MSGAGFSQSMAMTDEYFPLHKGSYSVYAAHVEWCARSTATGSLGTKEAEIKWKSEVTDVYKEGNIEAGRVRGLVDDLAWYEPGKEPSDRIILRVGATHYYLISDHVEEAWSEITSSKGTSYLECLAEAEPFLEAPLTMGAHFGEIGETPRNMYCYVVESAKAFNANSVRGAPSLKKMMEYTIAFRTNPDHSIVGFVPHLGITRYTYCHHGTTANAEARLIEYKR